MAVIGTGNPTFLDIIKSQDPDGSQAQVVEALQQRNPILMDATAQEGNLPTGDRINIRSGLPAIGWRRINEGVSASKSTSIQVDETAGLLEGRSVIDSELLRINGNSAAFRSKEDRAFVQSMNNEVATALFYHSTKATPEKILGLTPRFDALTADPNSENVIDAGLTPAGSDQASMWFITWDPEICYMMFPKGMTGGLSSKDLGEDYEDDPADSTKKFLAWRTHWIWRLGLVVKDWRYIVRVCNIDLGDITATGTELITAMVKAYNHLYSVGVGRQVIYCNRTVLQWIDLQVMNKANIWFAPTMWHGKQISGFRGIPIVPCDALLSTEAAVT